MSDMKKLFEELIAENQKHRDKLEELIVASSKRSASASSDVTKALSELREDNEANSAYIRSLWNRVNGSEPPSVAAMSARKPAPVPLDEMVSSHDLDLAALQGTMIALGAKVGSLAKEFEDMNTRSVFSAEELRKQSVKLGVDKRGMDWVLSPDGFKSITALIAAISALFSAIGMAYAAWTGHLPLGGGHGP